LRYPDIASQRLILFQKARWLATQTKTAAAVDHNERSEAQLHEGDRMWRGSVERSCGPMNKNRIEGVADQGERGQYPRSSRDQGEAA
jgi:hypothetical protein